MQTSVELRWFFQGALPKEAADWLQSEVFAHKRKNERTDVYFSLPGNEDLSIKLREGNLEIKRLRKIFGATRFNNDVEGQVEEWVKWVLPVRDDSMRIADNSEDRAFWIPIRKTRWLSKLEITGGDNLEAVDPSRSVEQGCNIELTDIVVDEQIWWSLGFESFGDPDSIERNLIVVVERTLPKMNLPALAANYSYGYPKWLFLLPANT